MKKFLTFLKKAVILTSLFIGMLALIVLVVSTLVFFLLTNPLKTLVVLLVMCIVFLAVMATSSIREMYHNRRAKQN